MALNREARVPDTQQALRVEDAQGRPDQGRTDLRAPVTPTSTMTGTAHCPPVRGQKSTSPATIHPMRAAGGDCAQCLQQEGPVTAGLVHVSRTPVLYWL